MIKKIDVLLPIRSQYEVIHHFAEKIYEAFRRAGVKARLLKKEQFDATFKKSPPDIAVGFNGAPRDEEGKMLCDIYKIPYLSFLIDPPYHFPYLIDSPFVSIGCDDKICCKMLRDSGFDRTFLFPNAVEPELAPDSTIEKVYDVVMLNTFIDFEQIRKDWPSKFDKKIVDALHDAAEETFINRDKSFITAFQDTYKGHFDWIALAAPLQELELYIKGKDRALLAKSVEGTTLHIFGGTIGKRSWKDYLGKKHPSIYAHNPVTFEESLEITKRTKVLLNPCVKNKEGAHDRVFSGISCGAFVMTSHSLYLKETFKDGDGLAYYNHAELDKVQDWVTSYANDDSKRNKAIRKGYAIVQKHHTWDQRVAQLLAIF